MAPDRHARPRRCLSVPNALAGPVRDDRSAAGPQSEMRASAFPTMAAVDAASGSTVEPAPELALARCPVNHGAPPSNELEVTPQRSRPDQFVRTMLRIPERSPGVSVQSAHAAFQRSMAISALRCSLTYLVFPFLIPVIGFTAGVGPALGVLIGVIAMGCDVFTVRRFFAVDHRWRWQFSIVVVAVMAFLSVLIVEDISQLI